MSSSTAPLKSDGSGSKQDLLENGSLSSSNTNQDESEHTLTGFGDISHAKIDFMPTIPSEIISERSSSHRPNTKRPLPPTFRKTMAKKLETLDDFTTLLENLRDLGNERAVADVEKIHATQAKLPSIDRVGMSTTAQKLPSPLKISRGTGQVSNVPPSPVSPSKLFRGSAPLPRRSPLPRWDLLYPDVYLDGKQYKVRSS